MINTEKDVVWKPYPEYPFIEANQFGQIRTKDRYVICKNGVKRLVRGHILKQYLNPNGYMYVVFGVNGNLVNLSVHRIVATCFISNPKNLPEVNHIDNNPKNNSASNLEWCTHKYNITYREKYGVSAAEALGRPVFVVNLETLEVLCFESRYEAAKQLGIGHGNISNVVNGRRNQAGGYWFTENESEITKEKIQEIKNSMRFRGGVIAVNLETLEVLCFESQKEASQQLGVVNSNVNRVLKGQQKTAGGYWFCYANENAIESIRIKFGDDVANEVKILMEKHLK